jgi:hypothetical protein
MAIIKPNNNTISAITALPNGIVSATALASGVGGKVLQVVSTPQNDLSQASNNTTTFADVSGVDLVFTPTSSSSKFIYYLNYNFDSGGNGHGLDSQLTFNHSGISQSQVDPADDNYAFHIFADRANIWVAKNYYHTPNTTNEITLRLQFRSVDPGESVYLNRKTLQITAMEYA